MSKIEFLYLSQSEVHQTGVLEMNRINEVLEDVFKLHSNGNCIVPIKQVLRWGDSKSEYTKGRINSMPGYIGGQYEMAGEKWISSFPSNIERGLPRGIGILILNDTKTGVPLCIMDGTSISAFRTGAIAGLAAKYLARPKAESLGVIGTGVISKHSILSVLEAVQSISRIRVFSIDSLNAKRKFIEEIRRSKDIEVTIEDGPDASVRDADIIITATTATQPILTNPNEIRDGTLICNIGNFECSAEVVNRASKLVVDDWEQVKHRGIQTLAILANQGKINEGAILELGDIVTKKKNGRQSDSEIIFFNPVGMGVEDIAVGTLVYRKALSMGLGTKLTLF